MLLLRCVKYIRIWFDQLCVPIFLFSKIESQYQLALINSLNNGNNSNNNNDRKDSNKFNVINTCHRFGKMMNDITDSSGSSLQSVPPSKVSFTNLNIDQNNGINNNNSNDNNLIASIFVLVYIVHRVVVIKDIFIHIGMCWILSLY